MPDITHEIRCNCGRLLARRTEVGIELKCPRCRRCVTLRLDELSVEPRVIELVDADRG